MPGGSFRPEHGTRTGGKRRTHVHLFSNETLALTPNGGAAPVGNGNGIKAFGGTFSLVVNP